MVKMKDSGIEWIGEIPETWKVTPLYMCFTERRNKNRLGKEKNLLSLSYGHIVQKNIEAKGGLLPESFTTYNIIEPGDIIIRPTDLQNDKRSLRTGLSNEHGIITSAYIDLEPLKNVNSKYYHYLLHSYDIQKVFYNMGNGVRQGLNYSEFSKLRVLAPKSIEQQQIADFLDRKTTEIDGLIDKINAEIDTIQQYQRSVITRAVTKGLDPNVPMKDSGIEYINQTPENWEITRLKYILSERNSRSSNGKELLLSVSQKRGVLPASEVKRSIKADTLINYKKVYVNDLIFNKLNPALARFAVSDYDGITSPDFSIYYSRKADIQFLCYLLKTEKYITEYKKLCSGVGEGYMRLYTPTLYNIKVSLPPKTEQQQIADYLDNKVSQIQNIIKSKQQQINQLTEYKNSLIFEYVTGKEQVKEAN